jgi:hypothetical protein
MSEHGPHVSMRTQVWLDADRSQAELTDRANSLLRSVEAARGIVEKVEVTPTILAPETVLYSVLVVFRERLAVPEEA